MGHGFEENSLMRYTLDILHQEGWEFDYNLENNTIYIEIQGINCDFYCLLYIDQDLESILCHLNIANKVPYNRRSQVCEFSNRINYTLSNGNFEMDFENGNLRFRTFLDLSESNPSKEQILNLIWHAVQCFDTFYPGLLDLITDDISAIEAFKNCIE